MDAASAGKLNDESLMIAEGKVGHCSSRMKQAAAVVQEVEMFTVFTERCRKEMQLDFIRIRNFLKIKSNLHM